MAVVGLLAMVSWSAQADQSVPGWRAGVAASFGTFAGDDVSAVELGKDFIDDNAIGYKAYGQYRFNDWFGLEAAYHLSGNFEDRSTNEALPGKLELTFSGFSAQGLLYIPTTIEDFDAYVKAGLYDFDDELAIDGTTNSNSSERGLVAGAGIIFRLSETIGFRAEYEYFDADVGDLSAVNLGIEFSFGGK
ncbi:MAG: porin family protein [Chromatiales bacterium]|nr:porin family protein [Chromatiales bacterium]